MSSKSNSVIKALLKQKIENDAKLADRNIAHGADPVIEGREHLARTGQFHRQLKKMARLNEAS